MIITSEKPLQPRILHDYYPTPKEFAQAALNTIRGRKVYTILDPGAGSGVWGEAARHIWPGAYIEGVELQEEFEPSPYYNTWYAKDFLTYEETLDFRMKYDLIMGNPPFKFDEEFLDKSLNMLALDGMVIFLFRLAFLESQKRFDRYYIINPPVQVVISANRLSFRGDGKSDDTAYALYYWQKANTNGTKLAWLSWR